MKRLTLFVIVGLCFAGPTLAQAPDPSVVYEVSDYGVDGSAYGVTWTSQGASFDGINDNIELPCAEIESAGFDGDIGFVAYEASPEDYTPATYYTIYRIEVDSNNVISSFIFYYNNRLYLRRVGNGAGVEATVVSPPTDWFSVIMSYDQSGPTNDYYFDGSGLTEEGSTDSWVGTLANCTLGYRVSASNYYPGYIRNFIVGLGVYLDSSDAGDLTDAMENGTLSASVLDDIAGEGNWLWWPLRPVGESLDMYDYLILPSNQMAAVSYVITAGDYVIGLLLFLACLLLALLVTVQVLNMRRAK